MSMGLPLLHLAGNELETNSFDIKRKLLVFGSGNFKVFLKHIIPFYKEGATQDSVYTNCHRR